MDKFKIVFIVNDQMTLAYFRDELVCKILELGYNVIIFSPKGEMLQKYINLGVSVIDTPMRRRGTNPILETYLFVKYLKLIKKISPDCILTYTIKPNIYGGIVARIFGIPYFVNITGLGTSFEKNDALRKILMQLYKQSINYATCVFYQNKQNCDTLAIHGIKNKNTILLPGSGVNLRVNKYEYYPSDDKTMKLLFVAR